MSSKQPQVFANYTRSCPICKCSELCFIRNRKFFCCGKCEGSWPISEKDMQELVDTNRRRYLQKAARSRPELQDGLYPGESAEEEEEL
jgi:hypothetical protein